MIPLRPILSTLRRHKTAAALIVLEIALTCAIVCNAAFLIFNRVDRLQLVTGLADHELVVLGVRNVQRDANALATTAEDLARLRALPGVKGAAVVNQLPFGSHSTRSGLSLVPRQPNPTVDVATYAGGPGAIATMGLRLVEGRDFQADEYRDYTALMGDGAHVPSAILDRRTAERVFPGRSAIGQSIYVFGDDPIRVVGVVERLVPPHPDQDDGGPAGSTYTVLVPAQPAYNNGEFVVRTDPAQREAVLKAAVAALDRHDGSRIINSPRTYEDLRESYYRSDVAMVKLLLGVIVALLVVTAFGIVGLASFWVQQRTRMIGTRRALGATRAQVRQYFQAENLLLTSAGIALGMAGAYGINQWLMTQYELPRLPALYLPVGALLLWGLGQLAVLAPARRAAAVPPALAMRGLA